MIQATQGRAEKAGGNILFVNELGEFYVNADSLHLGNVLHSLLDNALKYCKNAPQIEVRLSSSKNKKLDLSITDNGIGMQKEHLKHAFDKFYRVPTGNVHDVKGFGLGLFYVKKVCSAHHWKISLNSRPGVGTTVTLNFTAA